jgi:argininosuccinate lyase
MAALVPDRRLLPFELQASAAHARALERAGVLTKDELTKYKPAWMKSAHEPIDPEAEDVHHSLRSSSRN